MKAYLKMVQAKGMVLSPEQQKMLALVSGMSGSSGSDAPHPLQEIMRLVTQLSEQQGTLQKMFADQQQVLEKLAIGQQGHWEVTQNLDMQMKTVVKGLGDVHESTDSLASDCKKLDRKVDTIPGVVKRTPPTSMDLDQLPEGWETPEGRQ